MSWNKLITILDRMHQNAKSDAPESSARLEQNIIELGQAAKELQDAPTPDQTTYLQLHAAINRLGQVLPAERSTIRQKITGLVKRHQAQPAYQKMGKSK